jgi:hypothetical protein
MTQAHAEQNGPLFAIGLAVIYPLHGKRIAKGNDGLFEAHSMRAKVAGRLGIVPFRTP